MLTQIFYKTEKNDGNFRSNKYLQVVITLKIAIGALLKIKTELLENKY